MAQVTRTTVWSDGEVLSAAALNGEFNNLLNSLQLVNSDISGSAAITGSKLANPLTGVTLGAPTVTGASLLHITSLSGTTPTIDLSSGNGPFYTITLSGSTTFSISNASTGAVFMVRVQQGSGTSYTNTWFSGITWITSGGTAPVQTTVSSGVTTYGFVCTGSNTYDGFLVGSN